MSNVNQIVEAYRNFSGVRHTMDIVSLLDKVQNCKRTAGSIEDKKLRHIETWLTKAKYQSFKEPGFLIDLVIDTSALDALDEGLGKYVDAGKVPGGGRQDEYWHLNKPKIQFNPDNTRVRRGPTLPESFHLDDERRLIEFFSLRGIEYGQWLNQQDRVNYLAGCALALYDLHRVLGFSPEQIGMYGLITVAFGARGRGVALGHFEPSTFAINLTRFKRPKAVRYRDKEYERSEMMFGSGGIGTFCHEFGHALDFYAGTFVEAAPAGIPAKDVKFWYALSFGRSNRTMPVAELMKMNTLRGAMERLLYKIIWKKPGVFSDYYNRVVRIAQAHGKNKDYWTMRAELFARAFEVYVFSKMKEKGWFNLFLQHTKYESPMYLTAAEFKPIEKEFDELIRGFRSPIRAGRARSWVPQHEYGKNKKKKARKTKKGKADTPKKKKK